MENVQHRDQVRIKRPGMQERKANNLSAAHNCGDSRAVVPLPGQLPAAQPRPPREPRVLPSGCPALLLPRGRDRLQEEEDEGELLRAGALPLPLPHLLHDLLLVLVGRCHHHHRARLPRGLLGGGHPPLAHCALRSFGLLGQALPQAFEEE